MTEEAPHIYLTPENSELKPLCPVMVDEVADGIPLTPKKIERKIEVRARYLDSSSGSCHDFCKYGKHNLTESTSSFIAKQKKKMVANSKYLSDPNMEKSPKFPISPAKSTIVRASSLSTPGAKENKKSNDVKLVANSKPLSKPNGGKTPKFTLSPAKSTIKRASSLSTSGANENKKLNDVILRKGVGVIQVNPMGGSLSKGKKKNLDLPNVPFSPKPSIKRELNGKSQNVKDPIEVSHLKKHSSVGKSVTKVPLNKKLLEEKKSGNLGNEMQTACFENKKGKQKLSLISHKNISGLKVDQNDSSEAMKKIGGISISEGSGIKPQKQMPKKKVEIYSGHKRVGKKVGLEEKNDATYKLDFKRGNIVDVKTNNTAPRRLKFKLRKVVLENLNSKADDVAGSKNETMKQTINHKVGINYRLKRVVKVGVEGKNEKSAYKLDFERGKMIDSQTKNTGTRRLKFKPRKVISENRNGDNSLRNLKKVFGVDEVKGSNTEHLKVVLKHQNIEGKKDVQNLLNNVIEETATRLVRLRKSKVKALVGAFESLMSLPDAKSSSTGAS